MTREPETPSARVSPQPSRPGWREVLPILILIDLVQVSVFLPGSLSHPTYFWISTGLFLALPLVFWKNHPRSILIPALVYVASACFLTLAANPDSGFGLLLFLPIVGVALLGSRVESGITIAAVVLGSVVISLLSDYSFTETGRRAALYCGMSLVISLAIITLRDPLVRSRERAKLLLKDAQAINEMAGRLAVLTDPTSIKRRAVELAATVGSLPGSTWRRAAFLRIEDGRVSVDSQFDQMDDSASPIDIGWPEPHDPIVEQAIRTGAVASGPLVEHGSRSDTEPTLDEGNFNYATWVPIAPNGKLQGLLGVATRRDPMPTTSVDQLVSLGHLVELALSNWLAHEQLEELATEEDRRRIARELHDGLAQELAFIASKATASNLAGVAPQTVQQLADAADRALDEARRAIVMLSETPETLCVSIGQTAEELAARHGMTAHLDIFDSIVLDGEVTENLLRIVREAITNAARHGQASTVTLRLVQDDDLIHLLIADDGQGFDETGEHGTTGFGLTFMEERCASIGGSLDVSSQPGIGTRVEVRLPA